LWVANPEETFFFIHLLLDQSSGHRPEAYLE